MKQYLPFANRITLTAGAVGMLLRFWLLLVGEDEKALYPANHISWILLLVLSAALLLILFLLARFAGKGRLYLPNFPASLPGALGFLAGCAGLVSTALETLYSGAGGLYTLTGIAGLLAAIALLYGSYCRYTGKKPHFLAFAAPCAFLCLRLFCLGHAWGDEPELNRFLFGFFATAACVLATWQLWAFSVNLGKRPLCLLAQLLAVYLCLVAAPGSEDALFYLAMAAWFFTNLCPWKAPLRRTVPRQSAATEAPAPAEAPMESVADPSLDPDIDAILAEFFTDIPQDKE